MHLEDIKDCVIEHAKETYPNECCGLAVLIKGKLQYIRCKNISRGNQFVIDPSDYAEASDKGEIVGICHSHVNESVEPSDSDKIDIEKHKVPWLIVNPTTEEFSVTEPSGFKLDLIGRKFKCGTVDCLTLVQDYYAQKLDIHFDDRPRDDTWWLRGEDLFTDNYQEAGFIKVGGSEFNAFKKHDVILMQVSSPVPNHAAVYIGDNMILHHCQGRLSSRDVYGGYWRRVTNMVLRHKELM